MKFNFDEVGEKEEVVKRELIVPSSLPPPSKVGVVKRVLMTRTEMTIYPNGQTYYKSSTWEPGKPTVVKKKVKKKSAPIKKVELKKKEEY